ncbi:hypothetical protein C1I98_30310 [Spongiactinospora gelatinilytica]|uniref:Uncharacterized protein n=1 Tax=Spongiactinospora gelatinilytica TaxID=2666298 RepID=A0A2W2GWD4_9ACTN|nr:hypothetical protein C1I98_30310 [Spongiactinospora gelatinilytica]
MREHDHDHPAGAVEGDLVRPARVVDRDIAGQQRGLPPILGDPHAPAGGEAQLVEPGLVGARDVLLGALGAVRRRGHLGDHHAAEHLTGDLTGEAAGTTELEIKGNERPGDRMPPEFLALPHRHIGRPDQNGHGPHLRTERCSGTADMPHQFIYEIIGDRRATALEAHP